MHRQTIATFPIDIRPRSYRAIVENLHPEIAAAIHALEPIKPTIRATQNTDEYGKPSTIHLSLLTGNTPAISNQLGEINNIIKTAEGASKADTAAAIPVPGVSEDPFTDFETVLELLLSLPNTSEVLSIEILRYQDGKLQYFNPEGNLDDYNIGLLIDTRSLKESILDSKLPILRNTLRSHVSWVEPRNQARQHRISKNFEMRTVWILDIRKIKNLNLLTLLEESLKELHTPFFTIKKEIFSDLLSAKGASKADTAAAIPVPGGEKLESETPSDTAACPAPLVVKSKEGVWMMTNKPFHSCAREIAESALIALGMDDSDFRLRDRIIWGISDRLESLMNAACDKQNGL